MNKCCKHFSCEWPNEAFSVPQTVSLYCSLLYLNQRGTFSPRLLHASRLPCALTAVYEWQLVCSHSRILKNHFSLFSRQNQNMFAVLKLTFLGGEMTGNSATFLLPASAILYEKTDFKNFLRNHFKPINEPVTIILPFHVSGQAGSVHWPK